MISVLLWKVLFRDIRPACHKGREHTIFSTLLNKLFRVLARTGFHNCAAHIDGRFCLLAHS